MADNAAAISTPRFVPSSRPWTNPMVHHPRRRGRGAGRWWTVFALAQDHVVGRAFVRAWGFGLPGGYHLTASHGNRGRMDWKRNYETANKKKDPMRTGEKAQEGYQMGPADAENRDPRPDSVAEISVDCTSRDEGRILEESRSSRGEAAHVAREEDRTAETKSAEQGLTRHLTRAPPRAWTNPESDRTGSACLENQASRHPPETLVTVELGHVQRRNGFLLFDFSIGCRWRTGMRRSRRLGS